jgi:hypothetical protein
VLPILSGGNKMPNVINNFRLDIPTLVSKMPPVHVKSSEVSLVAAGVVGTLTVVQLLTDWDPLGRCFTFWRQLRHHVSCCCAARLFGNVVLWVFIFCVLWSWNHTFYSLPFSLLQ